MVRGVVWFLLELGRTIFTLFFLIGREIITGGRFRLRFLGVEFYLCGNTLLDRTGAGGNCRLPSPVVPTTGSSHPDHAGPCVRLSGENLHVEGQLGTLGLSAEVVDPGMEESTLHAYLGLPLGEKDSAHFAMRWAVCWFRGLLGDGLHPRTLNFHYILQSDWTIRKGQKFL